MSVLHAIWLFFFFFSFAYMTSPAAVMKLVVFFRSSKPPYYFWWSGVAAVAIWMTRYIEKRETLSNWSGNVDENAVINSAKARNTVIAYPALSPLSQGRTNTQMFKMDNIAIGITTVWRMLSGFLRIVSSKTTTASLWWNNLQPGRYNVPFRVRYELN